MPKAPAHEPMTQSVYNIVKEPLGWSIFCDGVKSGGTYGSKEAALEPLLRSLFATVQEFRSMSRARSSYQPLLKSTSAASVPATRFNQRGVPNHSRPKSKVARQCASPSRRSDRGIMPGIFPDYPAPVIRSADSALGSIALPKARSFCKADRFRGRVEEETGMANTASEGVRKRVFSP